MIKKIPKKILIIKPSSLGDIVQSLPVLNALKDTFPETEIHWVVAKGLEGLFDGHSMIKKLWIINKDQWKNMGNIKETVSEFKGIYKKIKDESYDIAIDLQGLLRSGLLTYATRSPIRIGFKDAREGSSIFYTHKIKASIDTHAVERYLKIAQSLGCDSEDIKFPLPPIIVTEDIYNLQKKINDYAVIVPSARWKTKIWQAEKFGRLASMINIKSIIIGSSSDIERSKKIEALSSGKAISLAGKTNIRDIICLIRGARFLITNDTGPMHIAAALKIPVIAVFGPTNPIRTGPYGEGHLVIKSNIPCSPCYKKYCSDIKCMDDISVEEVYKGICSLGLY